MSETKTTTNQQQSIKEPEVNINALSMKQAPLTSPALEAAAMEGSKISNFYNDRSIFITGASGFIGKLLIEKLLRSCPGVKRIYVLMRAKRDKSPSDRMEAFFKLPIYERIPMAELRQKVCLVEGDVLYPDFGLSDSDLSTLINEVSVVIHSAASVKFDDPIRDSIAINLYAVKYLINLARKLPHLDSLVHVSTAYSMSDMKLDVADHVYPAPIEPEQAMALHDWFDRDTLEGFKNTLIGDKPNTYTYCKHLAEHLIVKEARDLPVVICRPSIVTAAYKEPLVGWIDNVNGPTGVILGATKGVIRTMYARPKCRADLIPVDMVVNMIITLGWFATVYSRQKDMIMSQATEDLFEEYHLTGNSSNTSDLGSSSDHEDPACLSDDSKQSSSSKPKAGLVTKRGPLPTLTIEEHFSTANLSSSGDSHLSSSCSTSSSSASNCPPMSASKEDGQNASLSPVLFKSGSRLRSFSNQFSQTNSDQTGNEWQDRDSGVGSPEIGRQKIYDDSILDTLVSRTRLNEQKQANLDLILKQFRLNSQACLEAKHLPIEYADVPVFHCSSGTMNPLTWGRIEHDVLVVLRSFPSIQTFRYPGGAFTPYKYYDDIRRVFLHYLPGYAMDLALRLTGHRPILMKIYKKFDSQAKVLRPFTDKEWNFDMRNSLMVQDKLMSIEDRQLFNFDIEHLNWTEYLKDYTLGARRYMLKESDDNVEQARKNLTFVYYRNLSLEIITMLILLASIYLAIW